MNRVDFDDVISVISTFFGVLLIVLFAIGVSSGDAFKGPQAFVLRWTVLTLAFAFSAIVAWVRWTIRQRRKVSAHSNAQATRAEQPSTSVPRPAVPPAPTAATVLKAPTRKPTIAAGQPARPADRKVSADVQAAGRQAIVFRQHYPPARERTLSFFGGAPVAPRGFSWPRRHGGGAQSKPFSFLMQIDCAAVPPTARLRMLPDRGVLYFFLDLTWGEPNAFRVLHEDAGDNDWVAIDPPDDLGVAFGEQAAFVWKWTHSAQDCPTLLPKWTFQPVAIEIPSAANDRDEQDDEDAPLLWPGEKAMAETLRRAQGEDVLSSWFAAEEFFDVHGTMRRPFGNYPHDWRAVQICSGLLLHRVTTPHRLPSTFALRDLSESDRNSLVMRIRDEARTWFNRAASRAPFTAVPQAESDDFWSWLADKGWLVRFVIGDALTMAIEASLSNSQEATARIPADIVRRIHGRHALASRSERGLFTTTPDRMLAPPVDVQGHQWDRAKTHLLLLELSSNEGLGHHFGEGVYQFWITPNDLKARRFDKVELTADAY